MCSGWLLGQLNYNTITQLGLFSRKNSERQGSRTKSVHSSLLEDSRDALLNVSHKPICTFLTLLVRVACNMLVGRERRGREKEKQNDKEKARRIEKERRHQRIRTLNMYLPGQHTHKRRHPQTHKHNTTHPHPHRSRSFSQLSVHNALTCRQGQGASAWAHCLFDEVFASCRKSEMKSALEIEMWLTQVIPSSSSCFSSLSHWPRNVVQCYLM